MTFIVRPLVKTNPHLHFCNKNSRLHERRGECNKIVQKHTSNIEKGQIGQVYLVVFFLFLIRRAFFGPLSHQVSLFHCLCASRFYGFVECHHLSLYCTVTKFSNLQSLAKEEERKKRFRSPKSIGRTRQEDNRNLYGTIFALIYCSNCTCPFSPRFFETSSS